MKILNASTKPLIFSIYNCRINDGGPSGFLAHNLLGAQSSSYAVSQEIVVNAYKRSRLMRLIRRFACICDHFYSLHPDAKVISKSGYSGWFRSARKHFLRLGAHRQRYIFFHDVWSLYFCADLLSNGQLVILQSHCPELPSEEVKARDSSSVVDHAVTLRAQAWAFSRANHIVFPNEHAVSPYLTLVSNKARIHYIASGSADMNICDNSCAIPLDPSSINFLFIGRRNSVKGYDYVLSAFIEARACRKDIRLFVAGSGNKERIDGVVDLGLVPNPIQWMKSCDYVINFNRQSYFDLSLLEALSVGAPLILACTGGHKVFESLDTPGIIKIPKCDSSALARVFQSDAVVRRVDNEYATQSNRLLYESAYKAEDYRKRLVRYFDEHLSSHASES